MKERNELQLSKDLNVITAEINSYKQVAGQAIFEIGRRLKHVKENDLVHGEFTEWLENIQMSYSQANRFMKVYEELDANLLTSRDLGVEALYHIATLPQEEREKEHITSKGETKTVDGMTVRELQEVKRKLRETEQREQRVIKSEEITKRMLEEEQNKEPKVIEKEVIREIDNTDYNLQDKLKDTIHKLEEKLELASRKHSLLERKLEQENEWEKPRKILRSIKNRNRQC